MKKLLTLVATAALATSGAVIAPVQADSEGCVTKKEFQKIGKGHRKPKVTKIFDTNGKQTYYYWSEDYKAQSREYRACVHPDASLVQVDFEFHKKAWRVVAKSAYWG